MTLQNSLAFLMSPPAASNLSNCSRRCSSVLTVMGPLWSFGSSIFTAITVHQRQGCRPKSNHTICAKLETSILFT